MSEQTHTVNTNTVKQRIKLIPKVSLREKRSLLNKYIQQNGLQDGFYVKLDELLSKCLYDNSLINEGPEITQVPIQFLHETVLSPTMTSEKIDFHQIKAMLVTSETNRTD